MQHIEQDTEHRIQNTQRTTQDTENSTHSTLAQPQRTFIHTYSFDFIV